MKILNLKEDEENDDKEEYKIGFCYFCGCTSDKLVRCKGCKYWQCEGNCYPKGHQAYGRCPCCEYPNG